MFESLAQIWNHKDLRNRIGFTALMFAIYRAVVHIPVPGVDLASLRQLFSSNQLLGLLDVFSGGTISNFSVALMGVIPYINASIIMQLMTMALPKIEKLSKEGQQGRRKINEYTRYLTVPLALLQAYGTIIFLQGSQAGILGNLSIWNIIIIMISTTAGTMFLMWIGELISEKGIGNGVSLLIFGGIIAALPGQLSEAITLSTVNGITNLIILGALALVTTIFIVYVHEAQRNIPVAYSGRSESNRLFGEVSTHLPLKVNQAGVIPIIFALSLILFPSIIANVFQGAQSAWLANAATFVGDLFNNPIFYGSVYFLLVFGFSYFYTWVVFNPEKVSTNLQKQGGFIPGIRPGKKTEEYLGYLINRITFFGGIFLGFIAVLPLIVQNTLNISSVTIGGIGMLIIVAVTLNTIRQINAQLVSRKYDA